LDSFGHCTALLASDDLRRRDFEAGFEAKHFIADTSEYREAASSMLNYVSVAILVAAAI
jgi:hypothetical protein